MKKYICIFCIITIIFLVYNKSHSNQSKYVNNVVNINSDVELLAMTLDGKKIENFPDFNRNKYNINITCKNADAKWSPENNKLILENIVGKVTCNIDFNSNPQTLGSIIVSTANNEGTAGYRYKGFDPDNYVWFNNEMWQIIGNIPTKTSEGGTIENLPKLIRVSDIGYFIYDDQGNPAWGTNILYTVLNEYYYGKLDGTWDGYCLHTSSSLSKCNYTNIGLSADDFYGSMVKKVYWNTGKIDKGVSAAEAYSGELAIQEVNAFVGIINSSDYLYAYGNSSTNDINTNWLKRSTVTLSGYISDSWISCFQSDGTSHMCSRGQQMYVYPVVYLDPSVYVISGDGTEANPYQLGM